MSGNIPVQGTLFPSAEFAAALNSALGGMLGNTTYHIQVDGEKLFSFVVRRQREQAQGTNWELNPFGSNDIIASGSLP